MARPFRRLRSPFCPTADPTISDEEFWDRVAVNLLGNDLAPDYDDPDFYRPTTDARGNGIAVIADHVSPCPICHEWGACSYDNEGRPMIHALYDEDGDDS